MSVATQVAAPGLAQRVRAPRHISLNAEGGGGISKVNIQVPDCSAERFGPYLSLGTLPMVVESLRGLEGWGF